MKDDLKTTTYVYTCMSSAEICSAPMANKNVFRSQFELYRIYYYDNYILTKSVYLI